jgi:hypothetical protein
VLPKSEARTLTFWEEVNEGNEIAIVCQTETFPPFVALTWITAAWPTSTEEGKVTPEIDGDG